MKFGFTFEQWSWIAGIVSTVIALLGGIVALIRWTWQPEKRAMVQAFHGIRIGASSKTLQQLKLKQVAKEGQGAIKMIKWSLQNGNNLSVTYNSKLDRIVYMEIDWCRDPLANLMGLRNFHFGKTTLEDIRKHYKSNGFAYVNRIIHKEANELIFFNAFELKNTPDIVTVFITSVSKADQEALRKSESGTPKISFSSSCKLISIALAEEAYLDEIWGSKKVYDPLSIPVELAIRHKALRWLR